MSIPEVISAGAAHEIRAIVIEGKRVLVTRDGLSFAAWSKAFGAGLDRHVERRTFREGWTESLYARMGSEHYASQPNAAERVDARRAFAVRAILAAFPGLAGESYEVVEGRVKLAGRGLR